MDKEQIEKEIKRKSACHALLMSWAGETVKEIGELQAQLAEAEKPELRDGDYGINANGLPFVICNNRIQFEHRAGAQDSYSLPNNTVKPKHVTGNFLDDLKALAEPLKRFRLDVHEYYIDEGRRHNQIHMAGNWHTIQEVKQHIRKLQRLAATAERARDGKDDSQQR